MTENADEEYIPVELESISYTIDEDGVREIKRETLTPGQVSRAQLEAADFELDDGE
jgi:hypothetical protein